MSGRVLSLSSSAKAHSAVTVGFPPSCPFSPCLFLDLLRISFSFYGVFAHRRPGHGGSNHRHGKPVRPVRGGGVPLPPRHGARAIRRERRWVGSWWELAAIFGNVFFSPLGTCFDLVRPTRKNTACYEARWCYAAFYSIQRRYHPTEIQARFTGWTNAGLLALVVENHAEN